MVTPTYETTLDLDISFPGWTKTYTPESYTTREHVQWQQGYMFFGIIRSGLDDYIFMRSNSHKVFEGHTEYDPIAFKCVLIEMHRALMNLPEEVTP